MEDASDVQPELQPSSPAKALGVKGTPKSTLPERKPKPDKLGDAWTTWNQAQSPEALRTVMDASKSVINSAITSYAPNSSPAVRSKAKLIVRKSLNGFDPSKGVKLNTYLMTQLQQLRRESGAYNTVHMPERVRFDLSKLNAASNKYVSENGIEPSEEALADYTGLSQKRIKHIRTYDRGVAPSSAFESKTEGDMLTPPAVQQAASLWTDFVYDGLGKKDQLIYDLRTGKGGTQRALGVSEIAKKMGVSPSAISQRLANISKQIEDGPEGY